MSFLNKIIEKTTQKASHLAHKGHHDPRQGSPHTSASPYGTTFASRGVDPSTMPNIGSPMAHDHYGSPMVTQASSPHPDSLANSTPRIVSPSDHHYHPYSPAPSATSQTASEQNRSPPSVHSQPKQHQSPMSSAAQPGPYGGYIDLLPHGPGGAYSNQTTAPRYALSQGGPRLYSPADPSPPSTAEVSPTYPPSSAQASLPSASTPLTRPPPMANPPVAAFRTSGIDMLSPNHLPPISSHSSTYTTPPLSATPAPSHISAIPQIQHIASPSDASMSTPPISYHHNRPISNSPVHKPVGGGAYYASPPSSVQAGPSGGDLAPVPLSRSSTANTLASVNGGHGAYSSHDPRIEKPRVTLEDFHIERTLGTGSFGRVRLVQYKPTRQFYAMKVLKKTEVVRAKQVEHVNNERDLLSACSSPFLVTLLGAFQDNINLYMVLEYVVGGELFTYLRKYQRFPPQVAKFYTGEVVLAFEYLHSMDIIYRDLKPENVLIDSRGHVKLTDFGFAKHVPDITWTLCGTPDYLAPEIIQSKGYGKAVDWYSLGVLIFEMLAGYPPFYDEDHFKLYEKILAGRIGWPSQFDPLAKDLVRRLLTPDLSKRFGNLKGGSQDIKNHRWLMEIDWAKLYNRQIPAPLIPQVSHTGDPSNFDIYPETNEVYGNYTASDPYRSKFPTF